MSAVLAPTAEEATEDWISFHLSRAAKARGRLERMERGTPAYGQENHFRQLALAEARKHIATLHAVGYPIAPDVAALMRAEGLA